LEKTFINKFILLFDVKTNISEFKKPLTLPLNSSK